MDHVMHGPVRVNLEVFITNGEQNAMATITMSQPGRYPSPADIEASIKDALEQLPEGFRLMTKREFWDSLVEERAGAPVRLAMPGATEFEPVAPAAT